MNCSLSNTPRRYEPFPTTFWTLIKTIQKLPPDARNPALFIVLEHYRRPVCAYYIRCGLSIQDAEDCFGDLGIEKFLKRPRSIDSVDPKKGRFRNWLLRVAHNHMLDWMRAKRLSLPLDDLDGVPSPEDSLSESFRKLWKVEIVQQALETVCEQCKHRGRIEDFKIFVAYYLENDGISVYGKAMQTECEAQGKSATKKTWQDLADDFGLPSWKHAARKADWVKAQLAKAIRSEIRKYVPTEDELQEELRELLS